MSYRKIKSNYQVMDTTDGSLISKTDPKVQQWLRDGGIFEESGYPVRVQEILDSLDELDMKSLRPLLENDQTQLVANLALKESLKAELNAFTL